MTQTPVYPMSEYRTRRRIEFADTDMGGIVHFSRFFVFMETTEHEFLRRLGTEVHFADGDMAIGWPRVEASCQYLGPTRFAEELDIHLRVIRKGERSVTYGFTFTCGERIIARGRMSSVCCQMNAREGLKSVPVPGWLAERIAEHAASD